MFFGRDQYKINFSFVIYPFAGVNKPISPSVACVYGAIVIEVHRKQRTVNGSARAVSGSTRADPQRSCRAFRETTVPPMHASTGGVTKLAGEIGLLASVP